MRTLILIALALVYAQIRTGSPIVEEPVRVEYVLLDVVATDKQGQPVTDLAIEEFRVTENGKRIQLESLDVLDLRVSVGAPGTEAEPADPDAPEGRRKTSRGSRHALLLDLSEVGERQRDKAYEQLAGFLDRAAETPGFSLAVHSMEHGDLTEGFVGPGAAREALERDRRRRSGEDGERTWKREPGRLGRDRYDTTRDAPADDLSTLEERFAACAKLREGGAAGKAEAFACIRDELDTYLLSRYARTTETLSALEELAYRFGEPTRPSFLLLVSPGFEIRPGRAATSLARSYLASGPSREGPEFPNSMDDALPAPRSLEAEFRRVVHACVSARVVFHTFDLFSFDTAESRRADPALAGATRESVRLHVDARAERTRGLASLSENSGGTFFSGLTLKPMAGVLDRSRFVYVLGYTSPDGKPGDYRKIKIKCRRKGVELLYRRGYFGG